MDRDEVARQVAERLGLGYENGQLWPLYMRSVLATKTWDALISSELRLKALEAENKRLREALGNLLRELDSRGPAYDPSMRKLRTDQARAVLSEGTR